MSERGRKVGDGGKRVVRRERDREGAWGETCEGGRECLGWRETLERAGEVVHRRRERWGESEEEVEK